jgi:hypothetical protein
LILRIHQSNFPRKPPFRWSDMGPGERSTYV